MEILQFIGSIIGIYAGIRMMRLALDLDEYLYKVKLRTRKGMTIDPSSGLISTANPDDF